MEKTQMSLAEVQEMVDSWIKKYGVKYFQPLTNLGILMEETGEFARYLVRIHGEQSFKNKEEECSAKDNLRNEWADMFWVMVCLANQLNIDIEAAFKETMDKKTKRDATRHLENEKLKK